MLPYFDEVKQQLMLPQLFNGGLETLLNGFIRHTEGCELYLRKLNGKVLAVQLTYLDVCLYFVFSTQYIDVLEQYPDMPDCEITITPSVLFKPPKKSELTRYINNKSIVLNGDIQVLQDFIALIDYWEKDPAELLAPYTGDIIAQSAVDFGRKILTGFSRKIAQSRSHWGERLTEEYELIAPALAIADFCDQVKILEKQTALLEQKIKQLNED